MYLHHTANLIQWLLSGYFCLQIQEKCKSSEWSLKYCQQDFPRKCIGNIASTISQENALE
jgi:hypothetical protein